MVTDLGRATSVVLATDEVAEQERENNKNRVRIEEKDHVHDEWYKEAQDIKPEDLPAFLERLQTRYEHDYGTICHAIAAGMIATGTAMNRGPQGGITGFQAGAIMWEFIRHWGHIEGPASLINYDYMLYPQYENRFTTIDSETFAYLQNKAKEYLAEEDKGMADMRTHWQSIVDGKVPFGYTIVD